MPWYFLLFGSVGINIHSSGQSGCLMVHLRFSPSDSFSSSRRLSVMKMPSNSSFMFTAAPSWFQLMLAAVFALLTLHTATSVPFSYSSRASEAGGPEHWGWKQQIRNSYAVCVIVTNKVDKLCRISMSSFNLVELYLPSSEFLLKSTFTGCTWWWLVGLPSVDPHQVAYFDLWPRHPKDISPQQP